MRFHVSMAVAASVTILLAGCGGGAGNSSANAGAPAAAPGGTVVAQAENATITQDGSGNMTITSDKGTAQITTGAVTGDMPGGLPAYPNAQTQGGINFSGQGEGGSGRVVSFSTTDQPAQVIEFYARAAAAGGMQTVGRTTMGAAEALTLSRGDEGIVVTATALGGSTQVQIAAGSR